jgi:hypothetical protein
MLAYLGISNIRQTSPIDATSLSNMQAVGGLGAKIDLVVNGGGPVNLAGAMATVDQLAPYLNAVEGVNEANIYGIEYKGLGGVDAAAALQKDLYAAVKADSALANVPVYMFTIGGADPSAFPSLGDLSAYTDYANIHSYPTGGMRPCFVIHAAIDGGRTDAPSAPIVITETGYYTLPQNAAWGGVPEAVQANYLLGLVLDEAAAGVSRTYLYDLIDDGADPQQANREDHWGLFYNDGTPKTSATAFHNMTAILADIGPNSRTFQPDSFAFTATGVPYDYTGNTMLLDKSDGTHVVAVWNEEQLWDPNTQTASAVQHFPVTVDLQKSYATVLIYDPTVGTAAVQTLHNVSKVDLDLTDHPLFIMVPPPTAAGTPQSVIIGSGSDALVVTVNEDAYKDDAQFTVSVDGTKLGVTQTATALRTSGQTQAFTFKGNWSAGQHTVTVNFLNDAYGGSAATDRNLYVTAMSYDGINYAANTAALKSAGPVTFKVNTAGATPPVTTGSITISTGQTIAVPTGIYTVNMAGTSETVTAGSSADTFVFNNTVSAVATINGFKLGIDKITSTHGLHDFVNTSAGVDMWLDDGTHVTLAGVTNAAAAQVMSSTTNNVMTVYGGQNVTTQAGFTDTVNIVGSGNATVSVGGKADTINCNTGTDTIQVVAGNVTVNGNNGNISFIGGGSGTATLNLKGGITTATFGNGGATINVAGNDTFTGGTRAEVYNLVNDASIDTVVINKFVVGIDHLHLSGYGKGTAGVNSITDASAGMSIKLTDGSAVSLPGVHTSFSQIFV